MTNETDFQEKKPAYYILDNCTRCGRCAQKCPLHALVPRQGITGSICGSAMDAGSAMTSARSGQWRREADQSKACEAEKVNCGCDQSWRFKHEIRCH